MDNFLIVGGGLTGATAAETLREEGFEGSIRILGAEDHLPYSRPPLSKEYFTGKAERDSVFVHPAEWYAEHRIEVASGAEVVSLDPAGHRVTLADDRTLPYDKLLLATAATPRTLSVLGADARGIHYLRTEEDSERLREALAGGGCTLVIVGDGWIGLELASAACGYGNNVTMIVRETMPLQGPLGDELGTVFRKL